MRITPIDIQQQRFSRELRGYERQEVGAFLHMVADQMSELISENNDLRAELRRNKRELEEHREREATLKEAMVTAQRAIEEIREQAQKEAQHVVSDAELRAEKIVHNAHSRATKIEEEVNELRRQRARMTEELRGILNTHSKLLDVHVGQDADTDEAQSNVTVLDRVRAPTPPEAVELDAADFSS